MTNVETAKQRLAVVGSGVAGLTAAWLLRDRYDVTLYERNDYPGGHTHTVTVREGGRDVPVDTGFIVCNPRNYPLFLKMMARLGVSLRNGDMSFGFHDERTGLQYAGTDLNALFAQRGNLLRPRFWGMVREILRFFRQARADLADPDLAVQTLGEYLDRHGFSRAFRDDHLLPMAAAIWSAPARRIEEFPAAAFIRFLSNHGLLSVDDRPQWMTVVGGSSTYVRRMLAEFPGEVRLAAPVARVARARNGACVSTVAGDTAEYDHVIIAAHADEALAMLADPTPAQRETLGAWSYTSNRTVLHSDPSVMPPNRRAWASWNVCRERGMTDDQPVSVSYDMCRLQGLDTECGYFVSLNRNRPLDPARVHMETLYTHPLYTAAAIASQARLPALNGPDEPVLFCGSYFGYGFHEDAVRSAVAVAGLLGGETLA